MQTYIFSSGTWSQGMDMPQNTKEHATVAISDTEVLICNGYQTTNSLDDSCWIYDDVVGNFTQIASLNQQRRGHSLGVVHMENGTR